MKEKMFRKDLDEIGDKFEISLPKTKNKKLEIQIDYSTSPNLTKENGGLTWIVPKDDHPFVFGQGQPIWARSMFPCQDTPAVRATFTAQVTAPKQFTILMSALRVGREIVEGGKRIAKFSQKIPVQSYLIVFAVGNLVSKKIGKHDISVLSLENIKYKGKDHFFGLNPEIF